MKKESAKNLWNTIVALDGMVKAIMIYGIALFQSKPFLLMVKSNPAIWLT